MNGSKLSELEGVALGVVFRRQPCTAYAVRHELKASPSTHWQGSAGAVYPALERLERAGLLRSRADAKDGRGRRTFQVTKLGTAALRKWVLRGTEPETVAAVSDPVRTRIFFLDALTPSERSRFVTELILALEQQLDIARRHLRSLESLEDDAGSLAALGGVRAAEARVRWMKELRRLAQGARTPVQT